jgi:hypothetical protein
MCRAFNASDESPNRVAVCDKKTKKYFSYSDGLNRALPHIARPNAVRNKSVGDGQIREAGGGGGGTQPWTGHLNLILIGSQVADYSQHRECSPLLEVENSAEARLLKLSVYGFVCVGWLMETWACGVGVGCRGRVWACTNLTLFSFIAEYDRSDYSVLYLKSFSKLIYVGFLHYSCTVYLEYLILFYTNNG